jgi:hypothetical protein
MTQRKSATQSRPAVWHRHGNDWLLAANGRTYASIVKDCGDFICFAICAAGEPHDAGLALDLASAKHSLSQRFGP